MDKNDKAEMLKDWGHKSRKHLIAKKHLENIRNIRSLFKTHLHQPIKLLPMTFPIDQNFNELGSLLLKLDIPYKDLDDLLSLLFKAGMYHYHKKYLI